MNSSTRRKLQSSLLLLLALLPYILAAQVYNGNVNLTSQAQVNAFGSNYTKIVGKLDINGTDITDLTPLSNIDTVTGKLEIFFTDSLQTLNGLNISYVGGNLYFEKNKKLKDIGALSSLTFVGKDLVILNCKSLNNLNGLQNIDTIKGNLYIGVKGWLTPAVADSNTALDNMCALTSVITGGGLLGKYYVANNLYNPTLSDFAAGNCASKIFNGNLQLGSQPEINALAQQYTKITGKLQIFGNTVKSLAALSTIDSVLGKLEIVNTDSLTDLNGLSISYVGNNVYLEGNKLLSNINGLSQLRYIGKDLIILDCDSLKDINGLSSVDSIKGAIYIGTEAWQNPPIAKGNDNLADLCGLKNVLVTTQGLTGSYNVANNAYNPTQTDFLNGKCAMTTTLGTTLGAEKTVVYTHETGFVIHTKNRIDKLLVYNSNGQVVYRTAVANTNAYPIYITCNNMPGGVYVIVLKGDNTIERLKIVK